MVKRSPKRKVVKRSPKKRGSKKKKSPTAWNKHLMKVYHENKKKKPTYKLTDAMKDAKKTYKKK